MINKRKFMTLIKDYNGILGAFVGRLGHLAEVSANIAHVANSEEECLPQLVHNFILDNLSEYNELNKAPRDELTTKLSHHCDYGDINRLCSNSFSATLCNDDWKMSFVEDMNMFAAPYGNLSNTCVFRHAMVKDRRISVINRKFPEKLRGKIKDDMISFSNDMYKIYYNFYINPSLPNSLSNTITGFVRGKSYVEHAREHLGCKSAISVDISKFYDSISLAGIINNDLYYKSLVASFKISTGLEFEPTSFTNPNHFFVLRELFNVLNMSFVTIMNYYTHNGLLPTGGNYSPVISNIIFAPMDLAIKEYLGEGIKYTRYADDICISSMKGYHDDGSFVLNMDYVLELEKIVNDSGFFLNYDKTHIMGPRDKKKVAGIILDTSGTYPKLSVGSAKKLEIKKQLEGKKLHELTPHERGVLEWVKSINIDQYQFIKNGLDNSVIRCKKPLGANSPWFHAERHRKLTKKSPNRLRPEIYLFGPGHKIQRGSTYEFYPEYQERNNIPPRRRVVFGGDFDEAAPF